MLRYQLFPRSVGITEQIQRVIKCFELVCDEIKSPENELSSDKVLQILRPHLENIEFTVERGKTKNLFEKSKLISESCHFMGKCSQNRLILSLK